MIQLALRIDENAETCAHLPLKVLSPQLLFGVPSQHPQSSTQAEQKEATSTAWELSDQGTGIPQLMPL
jgi:hypothetical protein